MYKLIIIVKIMFLEGSQVTWLQSGYNLETNARNYIRIAHYRTQRTLFR